MVVYQRVKLMSSYGSGHGASLYISVRSLRIACNYAI